MKLFFCFPFSFLESRSIRLGFGYSNKSNKDGCPLMDWSATSSSLNTFYCTKHYLNSIYFISCVLRIILRTLVSAKIVRMMLYTLSVARAVACESDFHLIKISKIKARCVSNRKEKYIYIYKVKKKKERKKNIIIETNRWIIENKKFIVSFSWI